MMSQRRRRIAIIGCGDISETGHLPALLAHPRFELVALCDRAPERAALLAGRCPGPVATCTDHREVLARADVDAVVLALHPEVSVDIAIDALRAGKGVLDEKPLARSLADGDRLGAALAATRGVYQIGFCMRDCDLVRALAGYAARIGTPSTTHVVLWDERGDPLGDPRHFARIQGILRASSAITHEGSHPIDWYQRLNPHPLVRVHATARATEPGFAGPNLWSARFEVADGSLLAIDVAWLLPSLPPSTVTIAGPGGTVHVDLRTGEGVADLLTGREAIRATPLTQAWSRQLDAFAGALDAGVATTSTFDDGMRALAATVACEASARARAVVEVAGPAARAAAG